MSIESLLIVLAIAIHALIFGKSQRPLRRKRFFLAISIVLLGYPLLVLGVFAGLSGKSALIPLAKILIHAPTITCCASFLTYYFVGRSRE